MPGHLDQKSDDSSARPAKGALFLRAKLKDNANTLQKKAGNPKGLPAQGQYVSRHMRKPRVSSAFTPGGRAGSHPPPRA